MTKKGKSRGRAHRHNIKRLTMKAQAKQAKRYHRQDYDGHDSSGEAVEA